MSGPNHGLPPGIRRIVEGDDRKQEQGDEYRRELAVHALLEVIRSLDGEEAQQMALCVALSDIAEVGHLEFGLSKSEMCVTDNLCFEDDDQLEQFGGVVNSALGKLPKLGAE